MNPVRIEEFARKFKVSESTVRRRIKAGVIDAKILNGWIIFPNYPVPDYEPPEIPPFWQHAD